MDAFSRLSLIGLVLFLVCLTMAYSVEKHSVDFNRAGIKADMNGGLGGAKKSAMCSAKRFIF